MPIKLAIVGGVAGGATDTARSRRLNEEVEIILFERVEFISFAVCVGYGVRPSVRPGKVARSNGWEAHFGRQASQRAARPWRVDGNIRL